MCVTGTRETPRLQDKQAAGESRAKLAFSVALNRLYNLGHEAASNGELK
jgi:hypothetical protein